ncbi:MAG TPA: tetratricopeptide repeat protein [Pyrinomonadaceae bacterium]|nr:tetratricopeptide repeat protein [Pyrinomonadaceae bacterium]
MKSALIFLFLISAIACNRAAPPVANSEKPINVSQQTNEAQSLLAHSSEAQPRKPADTNSSGPGKPAGGGDPIDTSKFDATIRNAEKELKSSPSDDTVKRSVAEAYFARGFALTEARQYASALGDYRRALKLDPNHEESKKWIDQIISIYAMLKKEAPKEGQEPPPLPFKKEA